MKHYIIITTNEMIMTAFYLARTINLVVTTSYITITSHYLIITTYMYYIIFFYLLSRSNNINNYSSRYYDVLSHYHDFIKFLSQPIISFKGWSISICPLLDLLGFPASDFLLYTLIRKCAWNTCTKWKQ